ncbi:Charged multivesicular body protein 5 [Babesia bigemina]|uniref:Charged multivesicular body protein 5 n=1 Tax=Babesia bigemina TaxID=5866 RepID=A0A061D9D5_BABBI|nr:Charged multivesicular body protein 5 [Babesia bigemina]CDR95539.1 Charged multivesicular body protein 5 [Babesia bigemina]|eukprot:XP_012767725.1 Charged multivesicular body protein 5 [Babesia bigemina]
MRYPYSGSIAPGDLAYLYTSRLEGISAKISSVDEKINACNAELAGIKAGLASCKNPAAVAAAKRKALQVLQRRRVYETQKEQLCGVQLSVDQSEHVASQLQTAVDVRNALESSVKSTRKQLKLVNVAKLERLQDEMEDLADYADDINEILSRSYAVPDDVDENDLELEFSMLEEPEEPLLSGATSPVKVLQNVKGVAFPSPPTSEKTKLPDKEFEIEN